LAGQAVTIGVQGRALFAGFGFGASGMGRVGAIAGAARRVVICDGDSIVFINPRAQSSMRVGLVYTGESGSGREEREFSLKIAVIDLTFGRLRC